jgi:hypothetical protein
MTSKALVFGMAFIFLMIMGGYFLVNPSYEKSITAKYYYEIGEYDESYFIAKEAFALNVYNRMASTVMVQSQIALKYVDYINLAEKYMLDINEISLHETVSNADKAKIRIICEIMLGSYVKLAPSVITDKKLVEESAKYYKSFEKLLAKVTEK